MIINKELFDECFYPVDGIARVCLRGDNGIPKFLEDYGREKDGDNYDCSCFSIDIILEDGNAVGGLVNYMAEHGFWSEIICDNYMEAWEFFKQHNTDEINI